MPEVPPTLSPLAGQGRSLEPVASTERIEILDVLRGFALFGILLVNMALFSWPVYQFALAEPVWTGPVDRVADWLVRVLAEGKFYAMFSFLFGVGFMIQTQRADARQIPAARKHARRLLILLGIGLCHAFLLWEGDILVLYALVGLLLLAFHRCRPRTLLVWAAIALTIPVGIQAVIWMFMTVGSLMPELAEAIERELAATAEMYTYLTTRNLRVFAEGTIGEIFVQRARNVMFLYSYSWVYAPMVLAMFLLGLYAAQRGVFHNIATHHHRIRRLVMVGLAVGLPLNVLYACSHARGDPLGVGFLWVLATGALAVGGPMLCMAYMGALTLSYQRETWQRRLQPVAAAGRMALSNYLLQSLICTTIFYSYGLGLYGSVGRTTGLVLAMVIYTAQLASSVWWLRRFRFGPMEWLWRSLTYGRLQPMRRSG